MICIESFLGHVLYRFKRINFLRYNNTNSSISPNGIPPISIIHLSSTLKTIFSINTSFLSPRSFFSFS